MTTQIWSRIFAHVVGGGGRAIADLLAGRAGPGPGLAGDFLAWERGWSASLKADPTAHMAWLGDVLKAAARLQTTLWTADNPRVRGPLI